MPAGARFEEERQAGRCPRVAGAGRARASVEDTRRAARTPSERTEHPVSHRTIVIGDLHGFHDEALELLDRVAATSSDRVIFTGDLV